MDLITKTQLEQLAASDVDGEHVSLFMPTHRYGSGIQADGIQWKNMLSRVEQVLADRGMRRPDIEELLAPAWALHRDSLAWQHMSDGLAMFLRPGSQQTFRVPVSVPEMATVGERFIVGPLLAVLSGDAHFLLLAVSQRDVRLLEGSRHRVEEVLLSEVPRSLRDVVAAPEPRSDTMAFPTSPGGSSGPAVFYGHGAADEDFKKDEIERFLRQVGEGLDEYLTAQDIPMVLVGLDPLVSMYRSISKYGNILDEVVQRNPDQLSPEELHAAAWPVVANRVREDKERVAEQFAELHGTGHASTDSAKIQEAAAQGRVETLFLQAEPSCWEEASTHPPAVIELGVNERFSHCDSLDQAAMNTLLKGGRIYAVPESMVPDGEDIAAVFRY